MRRERRLNAPKRRALVAAGLLAAAAVLLSASPAAALFVPDPIIPADGFLTEVTITGTQYPSNVTGELTTLAPTPAPYPATGASVEAVSPQLITITDPVSGTTSSAYCIDFSTETGIGAGYTIGDWDSSNVPNLDYINYILTNYFPFNTTNSISGLTPAQQVAAVQSAIWYFSDGFVLATGTSAAVRAATTSVVQAALDSGGLPEPVAPELTIDPVTADIPTTGEVVGPFTVSGNVTGTLDAAPGVDVFFDADATQPVGPTDPVPAGTQLWARWTGPASPIIGFRVTALVPLTQGTVYLYDPESSDRAEAQKLVLAQTTTLPVRAGVRLAPYASGALTVEKTIAGSAAGLQDEITIEISCTPAPAPGIPTTATIPARATAPDSITFTGIPDGATCTVSEPTNGSNELVLLTSSTIDPTSVTVDAAEPTPVTVSLTNTYDPAPAPDDEESEGGGLAESGVDPELAGALVLTGMGLLAAGLLVRARRRQS